MIAEQTPVIPFYMRNPNTEFETHFATQNAKDKYSVVLGKLEMKLPSIKSPKNNIHV